MRLKELVQGIGKRLGELFPEKLMFVDKITSQADGQFFLNVVEQRESRGISARKSKTVLLDLMYFSSEDDRIAYLEWADRMCEGFWTISAGGQLLHTSGRTTRCEEMVFHFLFEVEARYIELSATDTMEGLEVAIEKA